MWIIVDIGCIECGEATDIAGAFKTQAEAEAFVEPLNKALGWQGGQHNFKAFKVPTLGLKPDYAKALEKKP